MPWFEEPDFYVSIFGSEIKEMLILLNIL